MGDFIEEYQIDTELCKKIIEYFEEIPNKFPGSSGKNADRIVVDKKVKDSTDSLLRGPLLNTYIEELCKCIPEYKKKYVYCDKNQAAWSIYTRINIQRYLPGEGYHALHFERTSGVGTNAQRHLVFITYLNDVTEGGETFFYYQNKKIQPRTGLTLIWPTDWTHTHCGFVSNTQTKYIVTGWICYTPHEPFYILPM
jgi:hypothetical protein